MKLYIATGSPNCRKVQAVIAHLDLDVEIVPVDIFGGELATPEFRAWNPNGKVPTLVDGDVSLWESNAIMEYLAGLVPGTTLLHAEPAGRAEVLRWQFWGASHLNPAIGPIIWERFVKPHYLDQAPDEAVIKASEEQLARYQPVLEGQLAGRSFVTGEQVTVADFELAATSGLWGLASIEQLRTPIIDGWLARLEEVPGWKETAPAMVDSEAA